MKERSEKILSNQKETDIAKYLLENPSFFDRHPKELATLSLSHHSGGAVSLIERQVSVLRDKTERLERQLGDLLHAARDNESLAGRLQKLAIELLFTQSADEALAATRSILIDDFNTEFVTTVLISSNSEDEVSREDNNIERSGIKTLDKNSTELGFFENILKQQQPICGEPDQQQLEILFPEAVKEIKSVAIIPLNAGVELGILGLGSTDEHRFQSSQGTLFLSYLSDLVSACLTTRINMSR